MTSLARTDALSTTAPASHPDCPTCERLGGILADTNERAKHEGNVFSEWGASAGGSDVAHLAPDLHQATFNLAAAFFQTASEEDPRGLQDWDFRLFLERARAIVVAAAVAAWNAHPATVPTTAPRQR